MAFGSGRHGAHRRTPVRASAMIRSTLRPVRDLRKPPRDPSRRKPNLRLPALMALAIGAAAAVAALTRPAPRPRSAPSHRPVCARRKRDRTARPAAAGGSQLGLLAEFLRYRGVGARRTISWWSTTASPPTGAFSASASPEEVTRMKRRARRQRTHAARLPVDWRSRAISTLLAAGMVRPRQEAVLARRREPGLGGEFFRPVLASRVAALIFGAPNSYVDRIMAQGFDGIYIDRADAFFQWEKEHPSARDDMAAFLTQLSDYARKRDPHFLIVLQNAEELLEDNLVMEAIDAIAKEDLLYGVDQAGGAQQARRRDVVAQAPAPGAEGRAEGAGRRVSERSDQDGLRRQGASWTKASCPTSRRGCWIASTRPPCHGGGAPPRPALPLNVRSRHTRLLP